MLNMAINTLGYFPLIKSIFLLFCHFLLILSFITVFTVLTFMKWANMFSSQVVRRRRPSVRRPQCSKIFSETALPIKAKFYVEPPWVGGTKFCSRHLGHMTKMAAMPIYVKNPSKIFSRTGWPIFMKLGI